MPVLEYVDYVMSCGRVQGRILRSSLTRLLLFPARPSVTINDRRLMMWAESLHILPSCA